MSLPTIDDTPWFQIEDPADLVVDLTRELWSKQGAARIGLAEDSLALYLGSSRHSLTGGGNPLALLDLMGQESSAYNLIQAITDTKINTTLKNKVRPMFITEDGDSATKRKAESMQSACDATLYDVGMMGWLRRLVATHGYLFEAGGVEWYADLANQRVCATPVFAWEYFTSTREARYGNPRQLFARHTIDRNVLLSYMANEGKDVLEAIREADAATAKDTYDDLRDPKRVSDQLIVYKAWHLPSGRVDMTDPRAYGKTESGNRGKANHDGRHVVAIDGGRSKPSIALVDVPWPHAMFPVAWFKPNPIPGSYWSRGEPEVLAAAQIELNKWNSRVARIVDLHAVPRTFINKKSGLNPAQFTNAPHNIFLTNGPPGGDVLTQPGAAIPPDLLERLQAIPQWARDQRGMSEMSMAARKPIGVNHEPGMQYLADTETERHTAEYEAWEDFSLSCNKQIIRCLRDLADDDANFEVVFHSSRQLKRVAWKDIDLGDSADIKMWPTNWLKDDPAERADQIADFVDRGILPPEAMADAVDDPDLSALLGDRMAMERNIDEMLDRICESGYTEKEYPNPYIDLQLAKRKGIQRYNELAAQGGDWKTINDLLKFLEDVDDMTAQATAPTAAAPAPGNAISAVGPGAAAGVPPAPGVAAQPPPPQ